MDESEDSQTPSRLESGRFVNPATFDGLGFSALLKFMCTERNNSNIPSKEEELSRTLPVLEPKAQVLNAPPHDAVQVTWLGHACVLVQMEGVSLLTDPVFSARCSPFSFLGPKRYRPAPLTVAQLPDITAVVISHNHYDHLDVATVKALNERFGASLKWYVPLKVKSWMVGVGVQEACVTEMDWWQEEQVKEGVKVAFTPAQHWSRRGIADSHKTLWGSWCLLGQQKRFYFAGDTAYCHIFKQIGKTYGPFDLAAIPIGAYEPRWFMKSQHIDPDEAVQVHCDIEARRSVGVHWGTFPLSYEPYMEPPTKVQEALKERGLNPEDFFTLQHGETTTV